MVKVRLVFLPSLAESLGIEETSEEVVSEHDDKGLTSVLDLLNRVGMRYRRFGQTVFDISTQKLTGKVAIFLNGHSIDMESGLTTRLSNGDTLTFVPAIEGG